MIVKSNNLIALYRNTLGEEFVCYPAYTNKFSEQDMFHIKADRWGKIWVKSAVLWLTSHGLTHEEAWWSLMDLLPERAGEFEAILLKDLVANLHA